MSEKRRGLGRGLGALIPSGPTTTAQESTKAKAIESTAKESATKAASSRTATKTQSNSGTSRRAAGSGESQKKSSPSTAKIKSGTSTASSNKVGAGRKTTAESKAPDAPSTSRNNATEKSAAPRSGAAKNASAQKVSDVSRETSAKGSERASSIEEQAPSPNSGLGRGQAKSQAKTAKTTPRARRDMGQALRSTTTVRRPVDMFFLPSDSATDEQANNASSDSTPLSSGAGANLSVSDVETANTTPTVDPDVSRETSRRSTNEEVFDPGSEDDSRSSISKNSDAATRSESSAGPVEEHSTQQDDAPGSTMSNENLADESDKAAQRAAGQTDGSNRESSSDDVSRETSPGPEASAKSESSTATDEELNLEDLAAVPGARFAEVSVTDIHPNRKQPRQVFDEDELAELAFSVKELGVLQPVVVRPSREGEGTKFELVMGERRWRAVQKAGLESIPAIIRETSDDDLLRDALLENLHRSQLNPLEEAAAYQQLLEEFGATQDELSRRIGRSRPQISNTLRLLRLPPLVQRRVAAGVLSSGHARALLGLTDPAEMERLAQRIVAEGMSVRATEETVALSDGLKRHATKRKTPSHRHDDRLNYIADAFSDRLDTSVKIQLGARKGKMTIEFASVEDLNRIIDVLDPKMENPK